MADALGAVDGRYYDVCVDQVKDALRTLLGLKGALLPNRGSDPTDVTILRAEAHERRGPEVYLKRSPLPLLTHRVLLTDEAARVLAGEVDDKRDMTATVPKKVVRHTLTALSSRTNANGRGNDVTVEIRFFAKRDADVLDATIGWHGSGRDGVIDATKLTCPFGTAHQTLDGWLSEMLTQPLVNRMNRNLVLMVTDDAQVADKWSALAEMPSLEGLELLLEWVGRAAGDPRWCPTVVRWDTRPAVTRLYGGNDLKFLAAATDARITGLIRNATNVRPALEAWVNALLNEAEGTALWDLMSTAANAELRRTTVITQAFLHLARIEAPLTAVGLAQSGSVSSNIAFVSLVTDSMLTSMRRISLLLLVNEFDGSVLREQIPTRETQLDVTAMITAVVVALFFQVPASRKAVPAVAVP